MSLENIKTSRLLLRPIRIDDAECIVKLRNEETIYRFFKNPHKMTMQEHIQWYENNYSHDETRHDFVIQLFQENSPIIGICGIKNLDVDRGRMELSYLLDIKYQKNGYAKEAVTALMDMAKGRWGVREVCATIHQDNRASSCFIKRLGFSVVGREGEFVVYKIQI